MGLIADIAESFKSALGGVFQGSKTVAGQIQDDLESMLNDVKVVAEALIADPVTDFPEDIKGAANFLINPGPELAKSAQALTSGLIEGWTGLLVKAMDQLNVDAPEGPTAPVADIGTAIQAELTRGGALAEKRVAIAVGVINLVVITGNTVSIAAEIASAGMVRSIAEAIQSWVWANGLGGMASMAYSPQMNASIGPWLDRKFNERAQAKLPGPADLVRFQLREVFLPDRREELVGTEDRPIFDQHMRQLGFSKFWADSYWGSHWVLPSIGQLNEMLFRGVIDQGEWTQFVRFNDFEPGQIPNLEKIIFNPFTRVDVRRMARMGILDDSELLQAYADLGNFAPTQRDDTGRIRAVFVPVPDFTIHKAQALVIFTKIFNALPELRARFRRGWISPTELLTALEATGIPVDRARKLWETIVNADAEARTAPERALTRALIARAFKLALISFAQGLFLLQRIGWSLAESELILRVQAARDDPMQDIDTALGARLTEGAVAAVPPSEFEGEEI